MCITYFDNRIFCYLLGNWNCILAAWKRHGYFDPSLQLHFDSKLLYGNRHGLQNCGISACKIYRQMQSVYIFDPRLGDWSDAICGKAIIWNYEFEYLASGGRDCLAGHDSWHCGIFSVYCYTCFILDYKKVLLSKSLGSMMERKSNGLR